MKQKKTNMFLEIQKFLYQKLAGNKDLVQDLRIFSQIPKNTPYPYLYLGRFTVVNRSLKGLLRMHFVNEIHLYSQEHSLEEILIWMDEIKQTLRMENVALPKCHISEVEFLQMTLDIMPDGHTHRVISKFRIITEETNGSTQRIINVA